MPDLPPTLLEILVIRELRKVGFLIDRPPRARRVELPEPTAPPEQREQRARPAGLGAHGDAPGDTPGDAPGDPAAPPPYALELRLPLTVDGERTVRALVVAIHGERRVEPTTVHAVLDRAREQDAAAVILFATADYTAAAVRAAEGEAVVLFRIVDGRTAFDMGGWGAPGHYPAWLPEHVAQRVVAPGPGLPPRYEITDAGQAEGILERILRRRGAG